MTADPAALAAELEDALRAEAVPERAEAEKRYLRSTLDHLGVSVPRIRACAVALHRAHPDLAHDDVVALVDALWSVPLHERRMAAVEVLDQYGDRLSPDDLPFVERLVRESLTWALSDGLAADVAGAIVARDVHDPVVTATLDHWADDEDLWLRRASLLSQIKALRGGAPFDRFGSYADAMLDEREFFVRKAIGWVLRETARTRPDEVHAWLLPRARRASGVTVREAVKPLSDAQREEILAQRPARAARR